MKLSKIWVFALFLLFFTGGQASAFCLLGNGSCPQTGTGWPGDTANFHSNGFSGSNTTFDAAFITAINRWNNLSNFSFTNTAASVDPCASPPDSTHSWEFSSTLCGTSLGSSTLAVARTWASSFSPLDTIIDSDIVFNTAFTWDVHSGSGANIDFTRVAAHESGHSAGISHDNTLVALMNTTYSDTVETPQTDDINGLQALYGGTSGTTDPAPDVKANGSDGPITISAADKASLEVTISLDAGGNTSSADWWVVADTSFGTYYYNLSTWILGLVVTHQGSLSDLSSTTVLNMSTLPAGTYTFYFGVDTTVDGSVTTSTLFVDSVSVTIQ